MSLRIFTPKCMCGFAVGMVSTMVILSAAPVAFAGSGASFRGLGVLPGGRIFSRSTAGSADGTAVVGSSNGGPEAFRWTEATGIVGLGALPSPHFQSNARAVSDDGSVVVGQSLGDDGNGDSRNEAFRWSEASGEMKRLGSTPDGAFGISACFVSSDGSVVVGPGTTGSSPFRIQAFRWVEASGIVLLGALPGAFIAQSSAEAISADGSVVVGNSVSSIGREAFRWTQGEGMEGLGRLPGGEFSSFAFALAVSSDGSVVVGTSTSANGFEAFRWTQEQGMIGLGDLPGGDFVSRAVCVSDDGSIVLGLGCVETFDFTCIFEVFVWDAGCGMRKLSDVLEDDFGLDLTGWTLEEIAGVSSNGTIAGTGINPSGNQEAGSRPSPPSDRSPRSFGSTGARERFRCRPGAPSRLPWTRR